MTSFRRPATYMLPVNPRPTRTLIVSDPRKMTYFAQANAVRAGVFHSAGALRGLGAEVPANTTASVDSVASGGQTIGNFLQSLIKGLMAPPTPVAEPREYITPADDTFLGLPKPVAVAGGLALAGGIGYVIYKKSKKR